MVLLASGMNDKFIVFITSQKTAASSSALFVACSKITATKSKMFILGRFTTLLHTISPLVYLATMFCYIYETIHASWSQERAGTSVVRVRYSFDLGLVGLGLGNQTLWTRC